MRPMRYFLCDSSRPRHYNDVSTSRAKITAGLTCRMHPVATGPGSPTRTFARWSISELYCKGLANSSKSLSVSSRIPKLNLTFFFRSSSVAFEYDKESGRLNPFMKGISVTN